MDPTPVHPIDLNFQGRPQTIASYLIRHPHGAVLVESGPGSTVPALTAALSEHGLTPGDVTHVLLTHIHLDHAGAAGWLARQGAQVCVHPNGAPHLLDPEKLLSSATRIYGDLMDRLWGEFLPVPEDRLTVLQDGDQVEAGRLRFTAIETPGHADHHHVYLLEDLCFSGDVGGVRMPGRQYLRLPMPPPELHLEKWRASLERMRALGFRRIAPTHFGIFEDAGWHLDAIGAALDLSSRFVDEVMPSDPDDAGLLDSLTAWYDGEARQAGVDDETLRDYELANPTFMSVAGVRRYWRKHRQAS